MNFIGKIEAFINGLILRAWSMFVTLVLKLVPAPVKKVLDRYLPRLENSKPFVKSLPRTVLTWSIARAKTLKTRAQAIDFKSHFTSAYEGALTQSKVKSPKGLQKVKILMTAPLIVIGNWLQGLSTAQACLLMFFTAFSTLSVISIGFSGHRIAAGNMAQEGRAPASDSGLSDVNYERPVYYKQETKHLDITAFRLPVYFAKINEVHSVDIDFTATMSSRESKKALAKFEFLLRDHLIINIEPSVASFPLEEEGKEIIREKIRLEINAFMREQKLPGEVTNVELTYVLAN